MVTRNRTRKLNSQGQRRARLSMALEGVKDAATRAALEALAEYVDLEQAGGVAVDGPLKARSVETSNGGAVKMMVVEKLIIARDNVDLYDRTKIAVPGKILGAFGYSTVDGGPYWKIMDHGTPSTDPNRLYWYISASRGTESEIWVRSNDVTNSNWMRAVIFYQDDNL